MRDSALLVSLEPDSAPSEERRAREEVVRDASEAEVRRVRR